MSDDLVIDSEGAGAAVSPLTAAEFPGYIQEAMAHVVHHSTWPLETLVAMILDKLTTSYIPGERVSVEGKQGTFKVLEQDATSGMYVLQPAAGGDRVSVESSAIQKRSESSAVSRVNADGVLEWLDQSAWCSTLGDDGEDCDCLWRMKRYFRSLYNLEESIPEEFEGKVTFPVERDESGERDEYQPSDSDAEMPDVDAAELAVKTRRKSNKMKRDGIGESDVDIEGDAAAVDLNTLEFDGRPLKDGLLAFLLEGFEDTQERMSSNEDKLAIFNILADVDEDGLFVDEIIAAMKENDCVLPEEMKDTRDHVNGICNSDAAFFKCLAGKFCLTAHVAASVAKSLGPIFVQYSNGADLKSRSGRRASPISKIEVRQIESLRRLAEQCSRDVRTRNTKCPRCHRLTKSDKVTFKTRNCNTCPRAYHQECLDESEMRYPVDSWSCSKCIESAQSVIRKLLDLEAKKKEAEAQNEKKLQVAERKQRKRMTNRKSTKFVEVERKGAPKRRMSDWDALDEEKKSIKAVEAKLRELRGLADVIDPVDDDALTVNSTEIQKAEMELAKLKSVISGPPQEYPRLFKDDNDFSSFNEAAGIAEFVSLYGDICELEEIFDTPDLLLSTRWPLDHARGLVPLYSQLLLCCLLEQLNRDPPMRSRARKWTRMLTNVTWPEVLRKYIEITRRPTEKEIEEGIYRPKPDSPPRGLFSDDYSKLQEEATRYLTTKGWWEMPAELQLSLLSALCYDISQGYTLKADMGEKIQDCAKISTDFSKVLSQARKLRKDKVSEDRRRKTGSTDNGSEDDDDNDDDDDFEEDISLHVQEKESQAEERLSARAFRTECMGVDRYGRRYWWLRGSQAIILVENADGRHAGIIKTKESLDTVMTSLIRRGPKEGNLLRRLRRFYKRICASFLEHDTKNLIINSIDRPIPTDGRQKQRSLEDLAASATNDALSEAKSKIDDILSEIVTSEIELAADLKGYRKELRSLENPSQVCDFMLRIEAILSIAGEGLPPYASNENMPMFLGEDAAAKLPPMNITEPIKGEVKQTENDGLKKEENPDVDITEDENDTKDAMHENGSEEIDHVTALIQENPLFKALKPFISLPAPVSCDDDYDCSEAEHTYLREKRMRKPARLWRSGRERAVWLKSVLRAAASPPAVGVVQATCCAFILGDRVNLLIERCIALEKEIARWEAEEAERQQAEIQLQKEKSQQMLPPQERPMMIRTGKAKTDSGVKIVLKLIGREPFPQGRNATTAMDIMASDEDVSKCRWGYQCSVCLLAGDLICCEHEDGCAVSAHVDCSGQVLPKGKWICSNHDESNLKTRVRKRAEQSKAPDGKRKSLIEPDPLADMLTSDEETDAHINQEKSGKKRRQRTRPRGTRMGSFQPNILSMNKTDGLVHVQTEGKAGKLNLPERGVLENGGAVGLGLGAKDPTLHTAEKSQKINGVSVEKKDSCEVGGMACTLWDVHAGHADGDKTDIAPTPRKQQVKREADVDESLSKYHGLSVSLHPEDDARCQLCSLGHMKKDLGKVLCFRDKADSAERVIRAHHFCAMWATKSHGTGDHFTMDGFTDAMEMASRTRCQKCGQLGAYITCDYSRCDKSYHLECCMNATDVVVDVSQGQLLCPRHTVPDSDDSDDEMHRIGATKRKRSNNGDKDDDFAPHQSQGQKKSRGRGAQTTKATSKGSKGIVQRPRTDWQRRGPTTWVKVVPPWWAEQKTVHFANKVFRELFGSGPSVHLIDSQGGEWQCDILSETRNDMRLQYTLGGQFQDLWDHIRITPGDVLTFDKDTSNPLSIRISKHNNGEGFEDLLQSSSKRKSAAVGEHRVQEHLKVPVSDTPWIFTDPQTASKALTSYHLAKMRCEIPDSLYQLICQLSKSKDTFAVFDSTLQKHFVFEMKSSEKGRQAIRGLGFMSWLVEGSIQPDDGIQLKLDAKAIQVSKIPSKEMRDAVEKNEKANKQSVPVSMDTLAAAAHYAHTHGTPGIKAILLDPSTDHDAQQKKHTKPASPRTTTFTRGNLSTTNHATVLSGQPMPHQFPMRQNRVDPNLSFMSFAATMQAISKHTWTPEEHALIHKFHAKYATLDCVGREITSFSILQFQGNKTVLLDIIRSFVGSSSPSSS